MAAVSVIDVAVNDEAFKEMQASFAKFQDAVKTQPDQWKAVAEQAKSFNVVIGQMNIATDDVSKNIASIGKAQKSAGASTLGVSKSFKEMVKSSKELYGNVKSVTNHLEKWVKFGSISFGLFGAGGLFGMDRLASTVSANSRQAKGLGVSYGEQKAFELSYGRYVDPTSTLSRIADAKSDLTQHWAFNALGVSEGDVQSQDPAQLATRLLPRLRQEFLAGGGTQQYAEARGLTKFATMDDLRRLAATPEKDLAATQGQYNRYRSDLGLDDPTQKAWQDFGIKLAAAGEKIENVFIKGLTPLVGPLGDLSDKIADAIRIFLANPNFAKWMKSFGDGLEGIATYLGTDKFQQNVRDAAQGLADFVHAIGVAVTWFEDHIPGFKPIGTPGTGAGSGGSPGAFTGPRLSSSELSNNERESWDFWKSKGLSDEAAAAKLGNEAGEGSFNPNARGDVDASGNPLAGGSKQWHQARRDAILKATGIDVWHATHAQQLEAEFQEGQRRLDSGAGTAWDRLRGPISIEGGVRTLVEDDERPDINNRARDLAKRTASAQEYYRRFRADRVAVDRMRSGNITPGYALKRLFGLDEEPIPGVGTSIPPPLHSAPPMRPEDYPTYDRARQDAMRRDVQRRAAPPKDANTPQSAPATVSPDVPYRASSNSNGANVRVAVYNHAGSSTYVTAGLVAAV